MTNATANRSMDQSGAQVEYVDQWRGDGQNSWWLLLLIAAWSRVGLQLTVDHFIILAAAETHGWAWTHGSWCQHSTSLPVCSLPICLLISRPPSDLLGSGSLLYSQPSNWDVLVWSKLQYSCGLTLSTCWFSWSKSQLRVLPLDKDHVVVTEALADIC